MNNKKSKFHLNIYAKKLCINFNCINIGRPLNLNDNLQSSIYLYLSLLKISLLCMYKSQFLTFHISSLSHISIFIHISLDFLCSTFIVTNKKPTCKYLVTSWNVWHRWMPLNFAYLVFFWHFKMTSIFRTINRSLFLMQHEKSKFNIP